MLFVVIYFSLLFTFFYTINLVDWDLINTYFHFILGEINFPQNQDSIGGFTKIFSTIYCSEVDPPLNNNLNPESSSLGGAVEKGSINHPPSKSLPVVTINHNLSGLDSIGQGLTQVGKALTNYTPVAMIGAVGLSTAKILNSIPPQKRVNVSLATTGLMVGATLLSQRFNSLSQNHSETSNLIKKTFSEESSLGNESSNLINIEETLLSSIIDSQLINSFLETINLENEILLAIIIFAYSGLYALYALTISLLVKEFSPENHPFVIARPKLLWYFKMVGKSSKISIAFEILLVAAAFVFILISVSYL